MFNKLTLKQQQWVAVGVFSVVIFVTITSIFVPLFEVFNNNQYEIEKLTTQLERYKNIALSREDVLIQATQVQDKIKSLNILSFKNSPALALADMQQKVKATIIQSQGEVISTQNLISKQKQNDNLPVKVGINIRFAGRMDVLNNILYELESTHPIIIIENIKITSVRGLRNITTGKVDPIDKVDVTMDIVSFLPSTTPP